MYELIDNLKNRYAIDAMQSVCLKEAGGKALGSLEEETTLMGLTFGGYLRSKVLYGLYDINDTQNVIRPTNAIYSCFLIATLFNFHQKKKRKHCLTFSNPI